MRTSRTKQAKPITSVPPGGHGVPASKPPTQSQEEAQLDAAEQDDASDLQKLEQELKAEPNPQPNYSHDSA